ncbi:hypothetical protein TNIN_376021 [Trichonephila inaurata madagascariensis]|uniref:Uncharacterized protein n=1 Tax=Trichonephila inaurata madagascariensis TaxID=2747483 RepID=A0A8X6XG43_9ARAC|nr:hypothetical protein TNIN_376021 [Trichonephila inaurata madagascariensis]
MTGLKKDQGDRCKTGNDKRKRNVGSKESSLQISSRIKSRKEVMVYKRSIHTHGQGDRRENVQAEASIQERSIGQYNLRPVIQNQLSSDHPEEGCRTKGDQYGPEEEDSRSPDSTARRIKEASRSLLTKVVRSRNRS